MSTRTRFDGDLYRLINTGEMLLYAIKCECQPEAFKNDVERNISANRAKVFIDEYPRVRKEIRPDNYMIRDYLQGLEISSYGGKIVADGRSAIPEFIQQLNILRAAKSTLASSLMNLTSVLQADLFDSETESARALARGGFLRAAGADISLSRDVPRKPSLQGVLELVESRILAAGGVDRAGEFRELAGRSLYASVLHHFLHRLFRM